MDNRPPGARPQAEAGHGELPLNTFGGSLGTGRIHGLWHIIEGALQASGRARAKSRRQRFVRGRQRPDRDRDDVHLCQSAILSLSVCPETY